jgi:CRISPR-associated protein Csx3
MMMKVVLCGPPQSGKSCFKAGLIQAIKRMPLAPYPYQIMACPDGEGSWFHSTAQVNPELAARERQKGCFSEAEVIKFEAWVRDVKERLTIVDVGGKISPENRRIMRHATHAVVLSRDVNAFAPWQDFCQELELQVIAQIYSDYTAREDVIEWRSGILTGTVHYLDRQVQAMDRPMVQALAIDLVQRIHTKSKNECNRSDPP